MVRVLLILVPLALAVYALVDCISSRDEEVKHLPKLVWILLIVLATVVGPLAWIFAGRDRGAGRVAGGGRGGWVAPDDNPEFLRSLGSGQPREGRDGGEGDGEESERDKELLRDWEEDLRRREDELRQDDEPEDGPRPERQAEEQNQQQRRNRGQDAPEGRDGGEDGGGSPPSSSDTPPGGGS